MTRVRRVAAVLTTVAAAVLATTAQNGAHAATAPQAGTGPAASSAAPATTALHLHVTGCDSCTIRLVHAISGQPKVWTSTKQRVGSDHELSWTVPTGKTHGMSFELDAPWAGNLGAVPNLVTRYPRTATDSAVSQARAYAAHRAQGCWAGTSVDDITLDFKVAHVRGVDVTGKPTTLPLAWAPHTMSSWKPSVRAYRGMIGNQDAYYCTKPATTKVTFTAPGCNGCQLALVNGARRVENTWQSPTRTVAGGVVSFLVPRPLTRGISASITAPWEGTTGYLTMVAWRYAGHAAGDPVSYADARSQHRGSPCWAGTDQRATTVALTVRQVRVAGTTSQTNGTLAYASLTQPWLRPMVAVGKGVLGTQEVFACRK